MTEIQRLDLRYNRLNVTTVPRSWDKMIGMEEVTLIPQRYKVRYTYSYCMTALFHL